MCGNIGRKVCMKYCGINQNGLVKKFHCYKRAGSICICIWKKRQASKEEPLFITKYGTRLQTLDVYRICQRVLKHALAFLPEQEKFEFTPHQLRHTVLKKVTDKHGVHFAQELSGNVPIKEIFRYAKPSQDEMQATIEELFE
ncbi:TPA: hypothetical protein ACTUXY_003336 [Legionella pneumophila]